MYLKEGFFLLRALVLPFTKLCYQDRGGFLSSGEFSALCAATNLRFGCFCLVAQLLEECSFAVVAGLVLQLLLLNPQAAKLPKKV
jgi:hypothetical protein